MLSQLNFLQKFIELQVDSLRAVEAVLDQVKEGVSELELAEALESQLDSSSLFSSRWYPTLVCAGDYSGQPLTRRNHLPSRDAKLRSDDIVILDVTPQHETVWANWSVTVARGVDPFYHALVRDLADVTLETAAFAATKARTVGEVYDYCQGLAAAKNLVNIDPRGDVGHNIFQVPSGQGVDKTPEGDRLFLDGAGYRNSRLEGLISVEPQLARLNPDDGKRYGGKHQFIVPYFPEFMRKEAESLISLQIDFYRRSGLVQHVPEIPALNSAP